MNSSYQLAPWADAVFAMDLAWWDIHAKRIPKTMARYTSHRGAVKEHRIKHAGPFRGNNSGHQAVELALSLGATSIALVGYDMRPDGDRLHWHAPHPDSNPTPQRLEQWRKSLSCLIASSKVPIYACAP